MKPLALAAYLTLLSACSTAPSTPQTPPPRQYPLDAMEPQAPLPNLNDPTAQGLARWIDRAATLYGQCRDDKHALIEWITK